jgi:hypothetical protein
MQTAREINKSIAEYTLGNKGFPVYAIDDQDKDWQRISRARTRNGTLEVRSLATGKWFHPTAIERR